MYHLATALPGLSKFRFPLSRDQVMLLIAATNEIFLGVDITFAHLVSGTIVPREWIPILFGPIAGALLLAAGLLAQRRRFLATVFANFVFLASILIGVLGSYYHIVRAILPTAPAGERVSLDLLIWAPPVLAPLTFAGIALLGISAAWHEDPPDTGILQVGKRKLQLPYSKTRAYLLMLSLGILFTLISSTLDHARERFENPWLWLPTAAGIFATVVTVALAAQEKQPSRFEVWVYLGAMVALILVGTFGLYFHINANLISEGTIVGERFLRGAPFMAPLLFCNMGMIGIAVLLKPET